jgi:hypothetical protein
LLDVTKEGGVPGRLWFKHMIMGPKVCALSTKPFFFLANMITGR